MAFFFGNYIMATNPKTAPAKDGAAVKAAAESTAKKPAVKKTAPARKDSSVMVTVCYRSRGDKFFETADGRRILVKGHNSHLRGVAGEPLDSGRAFGETVMPRSDWEAIKAVLEKDPYERELHLGYLYASSDKADARAEAKEKADLKTGFEPVDTSKTVSKEDTEK